MVESIMQVIVYQSTGQFGGRYKLSFFNAKQ